MWLLAFEILGSCNYDNCFTSPRFNSACRTPNPVLTCCGTKSGAKRYGRDAYVQFPGKVEMRRSEITHTNHDVMPV
jgi:hypothetical protein